MGENSNSSATTNSSNNNVSMQSTADYLAQLLKDRKQLAAFPTVFLHIERLLDEEINRVRQNLFQLNGVEKKPMVLPEPEGTAVSRQEKVYVPVDEHPEYNFVGRILGPRGMTAKQLEQETGCKIMVRGRGSMRDKKKEEANRGKPNWEHLNDKLHVLITVEDTNNRANVKIQKAIDEIKKLLIPITEGEDELKKRQLMELAIINGTYRDSSQRNIDPSLQLGFDADQLHKLTQYPITLTTPLRHHAHSTPIGAPLIISSRQFTMPTSAALLNGGGPPPLISPADANLLYHYPEYAGQFAAALTSPQAAALLADYPNTHTGTAVIDTLTSTGAIGKDKRQRNTVTNRYIPYDTVSITQRPAS
ncbi:protein held out wings-like isoform X2 [Oppia nitens]|uniref:protein held out wings-like isoform X2 n=1 Tax=Oppia nitens TaxID=1686743 RepID=UPI0023D9850E|nr:protein held out wings-like isoform X2 [Oppia nitens]